MLKKAALLFAIVFLVLGIGGFIPALTQKDNAGMTLVFGLFMIGALHNAIHIASGIAALLCMKSEMAALWYFRAIGLVYGLVTVIGFIQKDTVLGLLHVNTADNMLHLAITVVALSLGFLVSVGNEPGKAPRAMM